MIRVATLRDLPEIVSIYNEAVATVFSTGDTTPVTVESRHDWFTEHEPDKYTIYVYEQSGTIRGWCSLSPYRRGRMALRFTAEISYYVRATSQRNGIGTQLIEHAMSECGALKIKNLFAIVLEPNTRSRGLLQKLGFEQWGFLPQVADFDGQECGHVYYGLRLR